VESGGACVPGRAKAVLAKQALCLSRRYIEEAVISGLIDQLMHPDIIAEAVREYHAEMRRLQGERARSRSGDERKLAELQRSIERLIDLAASGTVPGSAVARRIAEAEAEANDLQNRLAATAPPEVISPHPKALDYYLKAVTMLSESLSARLDDEAMKPIRELVDSIIIYPRNAREPLRFEIKGAAGSPAEYRRRGRRAPGPAYGVGLMVPRDRIELPTRGFSIHCSTD
jgi:hypothetical protein